jgi:hypothetical protein
MAKSSKQPLVSLINNLWFPLLMTFGRVEDIKGVIRIRKRIRTDNTMAKRLYIKELSISFE